ncbi:hypothetical protein GCM10020255_058160 [Rhodococcus baikonurensis]
MSVTAFQTNSATGRFRRHIYIHNARVSKLSQRDVALWRHPDALNAYTPPGPDVSAGRLCGVNH